MQNKGRRFYMMLCLIGILLGLAMVFFGGVQKTSEQTVSNQTITSGVISEPKVARMLETMEGVRGVSVMLQIGADGQVEGVAVVCENGEDPVIREKITRLLRALYGLGAHQISVSG